MPHPKLEISGATIVMLGSFNPAIFHPSWFARNGLLPPAEVDAAEVKVVHPQLSQFETERFVVQVAPDRFNAFSKPNTIAAPLRDLVLGTFFVLEHTPVSALGMNSIFHFSMGSEEAWHRLGDLLAPKEVWKEVLPGRPGLGDLDIKSIKETPKGGSIMVRIQPSVLVQHGVYFEINDHYPATEDEGLQFLMQILQSQWDTVQKNGERIANHIVNRTASES